MHPSSLPSFFFPLSPFLLLLVLSLPSPSLGQCWSGLPGYDLAPDPPLLVPLRYSDPFTQSAFYFSPCQTVDPVYCPPSVGPFSQLCEIPPPSVAPPSSLISFDPTSSFYSSPEFAFTLTPQGVDLNTQNGDPCRTDTTRPYNVTLHFQCDDGSDSSTSPFLVSLSHHSTDFCQVEGVVTSSRYCQQHEAWNASLCAFGPYDYSGLSGRDLLQWFPSTNSLLFHNPCGFVLSHACAVVDPHATLCNVTYLPNGTVLVDVLTVWNGEDFSWHRPGQYPWSIVAPGADLANLQRLESTTVCGLRWHNQQPGLEVNWQCDPTAATPQLTVDVEPDTAPHTTRGGRERPCYLSIRIGLASMCQDPYQSSSTGNGPDLTSSSSASSPDDTSSAAAHGVADVAPVMWNTSFLTLAIICASVLLCLLYFAIPILTRHIQKAHNTPRLVALPNPFLRIEGEGVVRSITGKVVVRGEGVRQIESLHKPLLNQLDNYGAGGEWFIAPVVAR